MSVTSRLVARVRGLLTRRRAEEEADDELAFHLEQETAEHIARGMSPAEARRRTLRDLGGLTQAREAVRDVRATWLDTLARDIGYGLRLLRRRPLFTCATMGVIATGVGLNVATFAAVRHTLLPQRPYVEPERLVRMWRTGPRIRPTYFLRDDLDAIRRGAPSLEDVEGAAVMPATIRGDHFAESTSIDRVTSGFFPLFGVRPLLGRPLGPADFLAGARNVVIGERTWRTHFAASPQAIGRTFWINQDAWVVVGIMPARFMPTASGSGAESAAWIPYRPRGTDSIGLYGRLAPGATAAIAAAQVADVMKPRLSGFVNGTTVLPLGQDDSDRATPALLLLQTLAVLLLAAGVVSLANLVLAQANVRQREFAVRSAIGASRGTLLRQLVVEGVLVGSGSAVLALPLAAAVLAATTASVPPTIFPERLTRTVTIGAPELVLAIVLSWVVAVVVGPLATWAGVRSSNPGLLRSAQSTAGRPARLLQDALVSVQVFIAVVLLTAAVLLVNSFARALHQPTNFVAENLVSADVRFPLTAASTANQLSARIARLSAELSARLHGMPFTLANKMPFGCCDGSTSTELFSSSGVPVPLSRDPSLHHVDGAYFDVLGIRALAGRVLTGRDQNGAPSAVVNEAFATHTGLGPDVIGSRLQFGTRGPFTIVGVIRDVAETRLSFTPSDAVYVPLAQYPSSFLGIAVRARDVETVDRALRASVDAVTPDASVGDVGSLRTKVVASEDPRRFYLTVAAFFGLIAVVLATVGIYGVVAQVASSRRKDVGIRLALGAHPRSIRRRFVREGMRAVAVGLSAGFVAAWWLTKALTANAIFKAFTAQLFQITPTDPVSMTAVALGLSALALAACWIPARRASRLDPAEVLRTE